MMTDRALCLSDFEGAWRVERVIAPADGPKARFEGTAVWSPRADGMLYREDGQLHVPGQPLMHAERCYVWKPDLSVYFDDGRFFHIIPQDGGIAEHWCDPDSYKGRYDFAEWPVFRVHWLVSGPRKSYVSDTAYTRL